jgi:hypothetical protein
LFYLFSGNNIDADAPGTIDLVQLLDSPEVELRALASAKDVLLKQKEKIRAQFPTQDAMCSAIFDAGNESGMQLTSLTVIVNQIDVSIAAINATNHKFNRALIALMELHRSVGESSMQQQGQEPVQKKRNSCACVAKSAVLAALIGAGLFLAPLVYEPASKYLAMVARACGWKSL